MRVPEDIPNVETKGNIFSESSAPNDVISDTDSTNSLLTTSKTHICSLIQSF